MGAALVAVSTVLVQLEPALATDPTAVRSWTSTTEQVGLLAVVARNPTRPRSEIYTVRSDGSRLVQLTTTGASEPAWSPDGSRLAFIHHRHVWVMNADGGGRRSLAIGSRPAWSPDGRRLSFTCGDGDGSDLCVLDLATGTVATLVVHSDQWWGAGSSAWSPDGTWIVFTRNSADGDDYSYYHDLWVVHPDGTGLAEVPNTGTQSSDPAWSPDGTTIVYTDRYDGRDGEGSGELMAIHPDGTGRVPLTDQYGNEGSASWSPDGARIALSSEAGYRRYQAGVWTMNADGTRRELVARNAGDPSWNPTFSADAVATPAPSTASGALIAYVAATDQGYDLFTARPDGAQQRRLTSTGHVSEPAWSPDHQRIAFLEGGPWSFEVRVMDIRSGVTTSVPTRDEVSGPDWSPTGRQLVWADGRGLVIYDLRTEARTVIPLAEGIQDPAWSPDGAWIAYSEGYDSRCIKVVPASGGHPLKVTDLRGSEIQPAWSPDGTWIAFTRQRGNWNRLVTSVARIRPDGSRYSTLLSSGGIDASPSWSSDGRRIAVYSDGEHPFGSVAQAGLWTMGRRAGRRQLVVRDRAITDVAW